MYKRQYWNSQTSGHPTDGGREGRTGMTPLTTVQMSQQSSFVGWDFATIWQMPASGAPRLR